MPTTGSGAVGVIDTWLAARLKPEAATWLREQVGKIAGGDARALFLAYSGAGRRAGKADVAPTMAELAGAQAARTDWRPQRWSVEQLARARLLLALPASDQRAWLATLDQLCAAADVGELVAFYQALPLLPHPAALRARAAEGVRSNIRAAFEAVALDNPYPAESLDDGAFNQLVLKSLFVGAGLARVIGVDRRANAALARTLVDFAHERMAARRPVPPDLWRPVGPFADDAVVSDLARLLAEGSAADRHAAALALARAPAPSARAALATAPELDVAARTGALTWDALATQR